MHRWYRYPNIAMFPLFDDFFLQDTIADGGPVIALNERAVLPNETKQIVVPCLILLDRVKLAVVMNQGQPSPLRCLSRISRRILVDIRPLPVDLDG